MAASTQEAPGRIFISYRREETAYPAGWLYDRLVGRFGGGQVFKDVDSIDLGDDFVEKITIAVGSCHVLLTLIGDQWLTMTDEDGRRRLDDPDDFVRVEIEAALARNVRVIPILVDGARMPRGDELPDSLAKLARRQALELSPSRFDFDTSRLLRVLERTLAEMQVRATVTKRPPLGEAAPPAEAVMGNNEAFAPLDVELAAPESKDLTSSEPTVPAKQAPGEHTLPPAGRAPSPSPASSAPAGRAPSPSPASSAPAGRRRRESPARDRYQGEALATWWQRAGAHLLDLLIILVPFLILANVEPYSAFVIALGIWVYNRSYLQGTNGQSWGKRALRLRLVRVTDARPIGPRTAFVRNLAHALDILTLGVGYLLPLWDPLRQTLADKVMKTMVVVSQGRAKPNTS
jgi:uncharacterized RDD family membrane protein YckC